MIWFVCHIKSGQFLQADGLWDNNLDDLRIFPTELECFGYILTSFMIPDEYSPVSEYDAMIINIMDT
jgi:hypothetical protein